MSAFDYFSFRAVMSVSGDLNCARDFTCFFNS